MKKQKPYVLKPGDLIWVDRATGEMQVKKVSYLESVAVRVREWFRRLTY